MFANERYLKILEMLEKNSSVTVSELMACFGVSIETVRRDLEHLERQGALTRVHGGAVRALSWAPETSLPVRMKEHWEEKRELAGKAAAFIQEGDWLMVDSGSTAVAFCGMLRDSFRQLSVITHSMDVFHALSGHREFDVYLTGGQYHREENAFFGHLAAAFLSQFHVPKAFLFPSSIRLKEGVCDYNLPLAEMQKTMIEQADQVYFLADSHKFQASAPIRLCRIASSHIYVTDSRIPKELAQKYRDKSLRLI